MCKVCPHLSSRIGTRTPPSSDTGQLRWMHHLVLLHASVDWLRYQPHPWDVLGLRPIPRIRFCNDDVFVCQRAAFNRSGRRLKYGCLFSRSCGVVQTAVSKRLLLKSIRQLESVLLSDLAVGALWCVLRW